MTETGFRLGEGPFTVFGDTVAVREIVPESPLKLETMIVELLDEPALMVRPLGFAVTEKSGAVLNACTASPIEIQLSTAESPKATLEFVTVPPKTADSTASVGEGGLMMLNPSSGVREPVLSPCRTAA